MYKVNRLPMGLSVMQRFLNAILNVVRLHVQHSWGHIDDVLLAHKDPAVLAAGSQRPAGQAHASGLEAKHQEVSSRTANVDHFPGS